MNLLIPGRHHLLTNFQFQYLYRLIHAGFDGESDADGKPFDRALKVDKIIFAVTSSNHSNTRRNPLPFYMRSMMIHAFADDLDIPVYVYGIDDVGNRDDFAEYTLKKIEHESEQTISLDPQNTIVVCSTPVMNYYRNKGFRILTAELTDLKTATKRGIQPWDLVQDIAKMKADAWRRDAHVLENMHIAAYRVWSMYHLGEKVQMLFSDNIIGDDGDLTGTRDYNTYVRQMDEIADMKYKDLAPYIRPGRVGDIGCAVGSWIRCATEDSRLRESDFYGIEVSRHLFEICQQRKANGEFLNPNVFFAQKNAVSGLVFKANSMNTIVTSSLTHEIESYGSRQDLLQFIKNRFSELSNGGVWINRDVLGPENKEEIVYLKLNKNDGRNQDWDKAMDDRDALKAYLDGLSTYARFLRFAHDFRKSENEKFEYQITTIGYEEYVKLTLESACEFMTKKDYTDNWNSEMHERFCFWSFSDWQKNMQEAGFRISDQSKVFSNPWIAENRWKGKCELFSLDESKLVQAPWPVTTMILIAEK